MLEEKVVQKAALSRGYFKGYVPNFDDEILRAHNQEVYVKIIKGFGASNKVLVEQATGTGKTFLMMKLLKDHMTRDMRALFVSPTLAIEHYFLGYCEKFLGYKRNRGSKINLNACQYASLKHVVEEKFDIIILDEVHRIGAKTWGDSVKKLLLNNQNAIILGMTATLDRSDNVDVTEYFDNRKPVSRLPLIEVIKKGVLPAPDYTLCKLDYRDDLLFVEKNLAKLSSQLDDLQGPARVQVRSLVRDLQQAKQYLNQTKSIKEILEHKLRNINYENFKFIVFCPVGKNEEEDEASQLKMEEYIAEAKSWFGGIGSGVVRTYAVHSLYGADKNKSVIRAFCEDNSAGVKLLFAVNMLNEGLHLDDIDGVIMLRNTESKTIYLQQLGRALSVGNNEHPLIFDFVANINYVDLANILDFAKKVNSTKSNTKDSLFRLNIESLESIRFIDKIKRKIFAYNHRFDYSFDDYYARLQKYKAQHGNCKVVISYKDEDGYPLGVKTSGIRSGNIKTTENERVLLKDLGFYQEVRRNLIKEYLERLREFISKFNNALVPHNYTCRDEYPLGVKTTCIRAGMLQITDADKAELDRLGFVWRIHGSLGEQFIAEYRDFVAKNNTPLVPTDYISPNGYKLGAKVRSLRSGRLKITDEQRAELDSLGFVWEVRKYLITEYIAHLQKYVNEYDNALVPINYVSASGYPLGKKTKLVRNGGIATNLLEKEALNNLGFVWDLRKASFDEFIQHLREYKNQYKNCKIKTKYTSPDSYPLGKKSAMYRNGNIKITEKEARILSRIGLFLEKENA